LPKIKSTDRKIKLTYSERHKLKNLKKNANIEKLPSSIQTVHNCYLSSLLFHVFALM
jgi:hypothetical protein